MKHSQVCFMQDPHNDSETYRLVSEEKRVNVACQLCCGQRHLVVPL